MPQKSWQFLLEFAILFWAMRSLTLSFNLTRKLEIFSKHVTSSEIRAGSRLACSAYSRRGRCVAPAGSKPVSAISTSWRGHACAVRSHGQLLCFGENDYGQCDVPADLGPVQTVSTSSYNTCAVRSDGQLVCFGQNDYGQRDVPADLGPVVAVAMGRDHTCAVQSDGQL